HRDLQIQPQGGTAMTHIHGTATAAADGGTGPQIHVETHHADACTCNPDECSQCHERHRPAPRPLPARIRVHHLGRLLPRPILAPLPVPPPTRPPRAPRSRVRPGAHRVDRLTWHTSP